MAAAQSFEFMFVIR